MFSRVSGVFRVGTTFSVQPKQDEESSPQAMADAEAEFKFCQITLDVLRVERIKGATKRQFQIAEHRVDPVEPVELEIVDCGASDTPVTTLRCR